MTPSDQNEWRIIRESQIRMEGDIAALRSSRDSTHRDLHGDGSSDNPGLIKDVDRLKQRQLTTTGWLAGAWAMVLTAFGAFMTWLLNQGTK